MTNEIFSKVKIPMNILNYFTTKKTSRMILETIEAIIKIILIKLFELSKEKNQMSNYIIKLENDIRKNIKEILENRFKEEIYLYKIEKYTKTKEEFEQLKEKVKYKQGKFLDDDKKENEIFILRQENSNLKNDINKLEQKIKEYNINKIINNNIIINSYNKKYMSLNNKMKSKGKSYKNILNKSYSNKRMFNKRQKEENNMNKTINVLFKEKTKNRVIKNV